MAKILMKGNEALAEAAIYAGCRFYFGYPITPQNEIPAYMAKRMPEVNGTFLQAESEIAAINMVYGAVACGARAMTTSSSPGISLKQEGISYLVGAELPAVIANVSRGGPGLGNIAPSQADYFQATKGGGHGDYKMLVYAPSTLQETVDLTILAFNRADFYRNPVMILSDGILGQMMEPIEFKSFLPNNSSPSNHLHKEEEINVYSNNKPWALTGAKGRKPNVIKSLYLDEGILEARNFIISEKYERMKKDEVKFEEFGTEDADLIVVAFGSCARIVKASIAMAREAGNKVGLLRPITLFPFPKRRLEQLSKKCKSFLVIEMNMGQMIEDVKISVYKQQADVFFYGRPGGGIPNPKELLDEIYKYLIGID
ncbi:MAG: 3-methyl-2-oxobutanoate dehydrogenase subunit VorB, partial [bacterium]